MDGIILRMEFLHPASDDETHVILLLVVVKSVKISLHPFMTGLDH